jgi:hypothetical protein
LFRLLILFVFGEGLRKQNENSNSIFR